MSHEWVKLILDGEYRYSWQCQKCKSTHRDLAGYMFNCSLERPQDDALVSISQERDGSCEEAQVAGVHET